ncbi:ROK family protein [Candidatus Uabimicrobium sp. HlEnr_7]|uniref:ROK family protein n=1 Tax=Candidatus Uabimicrobium helgolandensis TaxID=3095367 RepID=UPI003557BFE2
MLLAIDIGGTKITVSIASQEKILIKMFQSVKLIGDEMTIPKQIDNLIYLACQKISITEKQIKSVGISTCSPFVSIDNYKAIAAPNLCGGLGLRQKELKNNWQRIPLQEHLHKRFSCVEMENDCVSAVTAERTFGAGQGFENIIYITWSTGIGCGAYVNGNLVRGKNGNAPHFGPIYMVDCDQNSGNASYEHLEALASGTAIARNFGQGSTKDAFEQYANNEHAHNVVDNAIYHFVKGLISINYVLDTSKIILGGSVFLNNQELLMPMIKSKFFGESFTVFSDGVEIVASDLGEYLGDLAALSLIMPEDWIDKWQQEKPWLSAPSAVIVE